MCCGILTITYVWTAMWMTEMKAVLGAFALGGSLISLVPVRSKHETHQQQEVR